MRLAGNALVHCALALAAACARSPETARADAGAPARASARTACIDAALARRGLNAYGDPKDTVYPGGTPLFDERTGNGRDRLARVLSQHPELARECPP